MAIPVSEFFRVTTRIEVGGVIRQQFGRGLLLTTEDDIPAGGTGKAQYFTDNDGVRAVFAADTEAAKAAAKWFGYDPYPQGLYIGRWANVAVPTTLTGGTTSALSALQSATATFRFLEEDVSVDTSSATTFAAVASTIATAVTTTGYTGGLAEQSYNVAGGDQGTDYNAATTVTVSAPTGGGTAATATVTVTAGKITALEITDGGSGYTTSDSVVFTLGGVGSGTGADLTNLTILLERGAISPELNGATFTYAGNRFLLTLAGQDALDPPYFEAHSAGSGTDISAALGLDQDSAPVYRRGADAEAPSDAVAAIAGIVTDRPTYLMLDNSCPLVYGGDDASSIADMWAFAEASDYIFGFSDTSALARQPDETTSLLSQANSQQLGNTLVCVADADRESHFGALAGLSSINWDLPQTIITLFGKTLPGTAATDIDPTELQTIEGKRGNVYTRVGGIPTFVQGFMARNGYWSDAVAWTLWMKNELESNIWNAARASRRLNIAILNATLDGVMRKGVRNGGIQPGRTVSAPTKADIIATTGNHDFDGVLQSGYLVHIGRLADLTQVDLENRRAPPVKIWAIGSEAIHSADVELVFLN